MAAKSNYLNASLLNAVLRNVAYLSPTTVYVALNTTASTATTPGTEDSDTNYARQAVTFGAPSTNSVANSGALAFYGAGRVAGSATIVEAAIYDAFALGNELYWGALSVNKTVGTGDTASIGIGALTVTET